MLKQTRVFFGKERQGIGFDVVVAYDVSAMRLIIAGHEINEVERERIIEFAIGRLFQNMLAGVQSETEIRKVWKQVEEHLKDGRLSAASGQSRGNPLDSRARGIVAKILQAKGLKAQEAARIAADIFRGKEKPEDHGLPHDVADKARLKAKQLLEQERQLLEDLLG